jgi:dTDP-4-dehydrorhamnose 3,5-epimerase
MFRGIHYFDVPPGQAKHVSCVSGAVLNVVVDPCSTPYAPGREHGVHPLDPVLGIPWLMDGPGKDGAAHAVKEALLSGALLAMAAAPPTPGGCSPRLPRADLALVGP